MRVSWSRAGEGFIARDREREWIEDDDQAGFPEKRLSPISLCPVPSRNASRAAVSPPRLSRCQQGNVAWEGL